MTRISQAGLPLAAFAAVSAFAKPIIPEANPLVSDCTSTTYTTGDAPVPPATWQPTWTVTVHTTTATSTAAVDCGGCAHLETDKILVNYLRPSGPRPMAVETVVATEPAVVTMAYCNRPPPNQPAPQQGHYGAPTPRPGPDPTPMPSDANPSAGQKTEGGSTTSCVKHLLHAPHFTWGPTATVWTSTATVTQKINCGGCSKLQLDTLALGPGPAVFFTTTVTASTASTTTIPACGGTGTEAVFGKRIAGAHTSQPHYYQGPPASVHTAMPVGGGGGATAAAPTCTTHDAVAPEIPNQTFTTYTSTVTTTRDVECGGCALEWSTPVLEFFAPIVFTATATATAPSTSVELACATPSAAA